MSGSRHQLDELEEAEMRPLQTPLCWCRFQLPNTQVEEQSLLTNSFVILILGIQMILASLKVSRDGALLHNHLFVKPIIKSPGDNYWKEEYGLNSVSAPVKEM